MNCRQNGVLSTSRCTLVAMTTLLSLTSLWSGVVSADGSFVQVGANLSVPVNQSPSGTLLPQIYMIYNVIQNDALLFVFSAVFINRQPFHFQVYRSAGSSDGDAISTKYRLIADIPVIPSVLGVREDFYIESLLTEKCVHVMPGDRLALYFPNPISVQYSFSPSLTTTKSNVNSPPSIGQNITFDPISLPYLFSVAAQIYTGMNTSSTTLVNCIPGLVIPNSLHSTVPTTTTPITGAPGAPGVIGVIGVPGALGPLGAIGATGIIGVPGPVGSAGATGLPGATGAFGIDGATGVVGDLGSPGGTGSRGQSGVMGPPGQEGPMGPPGPNFYVTFGKLGSTEASTSALFGTPTPPVGAASSQQSGAWWDGTSPMIGIYIWLAILSFVITIVLITIAVTCHLCSSMSKMT